MVIFMAGASSLPSLENQTCALTFVQVMEKSGLFTSRAELMNVLAECDENEDGNVQYREFLPVMVQVGAYAISWQKEIRDFGFVAADLV